MQSTENTKANGWLDRPETRNRIGAALGNWMRDDEFVAQIMIAFQDPAIVTCTEASKFKAAHLCASLQLLPSLGHIALIPRKCNIGTKNDPRWETQCHVMPQWQGYKSLMERHPEVLEVNYGLVFNGEQYSLNEHGEFSHRFDPFESRDVKKDLSNLRGGYLVVQYRDKQRTSKFHFVTAEKIRKTRGCAQTKTIWDAWPTEMAIKAVYRDGFARRVVPIDVQNGERLQKFTQAEDVVMQNDPLRVARTSDLNERTTQIGTNKLIENAIESDDNDEQADNDTSDAQEAADGLSKFVESLNATDDPAEVKRLVSEIGRTIKEAEEFMPYADAADQRLDELKVSAK